VGSFFQPAPTSSTLWPCTTRGSIALTPFSTGWTRGYPDQALEKIRAALTLAQEGAHPFSLGIALLGVAQVHLFRREGQAGQERTEAAIALYTEQGFANFLGQVTCFRGWALVEQGQVEEGLAHIQQGLAACRATGARLLMSHFIALLAEACGKAAQCEMGLSVIAEALDGVRQNGEHVLESELYR
jgi:predicted ATPase